MRGEAGNAERRNVGAQVIHALEWNDAHLQPWEAAPLAGASLGSLVGQGRATERARTSSAAGSVVFGWSWQGLVGTPRVRSCIQLCTLTVCSREGILECVCTRKDVLNA